MHQASVAQTLFILSGYTAIAVLLFLIAARLLQRNAKNLLHKPVIPFLVTVAVVHAIMPVVETLAGTYTYQQSYSLEAHMAGWVATISGAFSVVIAGMVAETAFRRRARDNDLVVVPWQDRVSFLLLVVLPSLYACYKLYSLVASVGYEEFLRDRIGYRSGAQGWAVLSNMVVVVPAFYIASYLANRKAPWALFIAIASLVVSAFFILTTGSRNSVFLALICMLFVYLFISARLPNKRTVRVLVLVGLGSILLAMYGQYRRTAATGSADGFDLSAQALVTSVAGAFGNHELSLWQVDNPHRFLFGETYIAGATVFVPRAMWPDKPVGAGPIIKNRVHPGGYVLGGRGSSSLTTGFLVEAWMNFGLVGPLLVGIVWGSVLATIGAAARYVRTPFGISIISYLVLTCGVSFVYSEFLGWMGRTVPIVLGMLGALLIGRILLKRPSWSRPRVEYGSHYTHAAH